MRRWLEGLGLGQIATVLAAKDIDFDALPELGDQDLKEFGLSLGHRKRLKAIAARSPEAGAPPAATGACRRMRPSGGS